MSINPVRLTKAAERALNAVLKEHFQTFLIYPFDDQGAKDTLKKNLDELGKKRDKMLEIAHDSWREGGAPK